MRRIAAIMLAALVLGSSATAALAAEPVVVNQNGVPVTLLAVGTTMRSVLSPKNPDVIRLDGRYAEVYRVDVRRGQCAELVMRSQEVDSSLALLNEAGQTFAEDDDSGGGRDAFLRGTFEATGAVYVVATSAGPDETGRYTLEVRSCGAPTNPRQPGQPPSNPAPRQTPIPLI